MNHWKTSDIKTLLEPIHQIKLISTDPQGSEMTTAQLAYKVEGANDRLYVRGFVTDHTNQIVDEDDTNIEMVEVFTEYSDGGDSQEPENVIAKAMIHAALLRAGFQVVKSLEPYF